MIKSNYKTIKKLINYIETNNKFEKAIKKDLRYKFKDLNQFEIDEMNKLEFGILNKDQKITTYTSDNKIETVNNGKKGDIIICGINNEKYIIGNINKLFDKYDLIPKKEKKSVFKITSDILKKLKLNTKLKFKASWGEDMILNINDFLIKDKNEYYRIANDEFNKTYNIIKDDKINEKILNFKNYFIK